MVRRPRLLDHQARVGFERTGSFHLLVVSGMHLAIFAACVFGLAALSGHPHLVTRVTIACSSLRTARRLRRTGAALLLDGDPLSARRLLFRERNRLNAIGFAAVCLLALDPRSLAGASFQMTLLSVLIVAGVAVPVAEHTFGPYLQAARNLGLVAIDPACLQARRSFALPSGSSPTTCNRSSAAASPGSAPALVRLILRIFELLLVSALIELVMALPMAIYFHRVTALVYRSICWWYR